MEKIINERKASVNDKKNNNIELSEEKQMVKRFSLFPIFLLIQDIVVCCFSFVFLNRLGGKLAPGLDDIESVFILLIISLNAIAFFSTYRLYSYYDLFSKKHHAINMLKAFVWGGTIFANIVLLYLWPDLFADNSLLIGIFLSISAIFLLVLSKYFGDYLLNLLKAMGASLVTIGIIGIVIGTEKPAVLEGSWHFSYSVILTMLAVFVTRFFSVHVLFNHLMRRSFRRQIAIIGSDEEAQRIASHIIDHNAPFWVTGVIGGKQGGYLNTRIPKNWLGDLGQLRRLVNEEKIDELIVTDEHINKRDLISVLDYCSSVGITVWFPPKLLVIIDRKLYKDRFCGIPMVCMCSQKNTWLFNKLKHVCDAVITLPIFVLQLPLFLGAVIAIKLDSKGPVFYLATMVGKGAKHFKMYKFRSMRTDTDPAIHQEYVSKLIKGDIDSNENGDAPLKITNDPRVTKVGNFIRKFSIDELPQLINVLKGEMSLVGPRPCLPYEFEIYQDWHKNRVAVRPGITGLWQVTGRSEVSFEDMILLDLYYVYNRSFQLDVSILYETIFAVLQKRGAY